MRFHEDCAVSLSVVLKADRAQLSKPDDRILKK